MFLLFFLNVFLFHIFLSIYHLKLWDFDQYITHKTDQIPLKYYLPPNFSKKHIPLPQKKIGFPLIPQTLNHNPQQQPLFVTALTLSQ